MAQASVDIGRSRPCCNFVSKPAWQSKAAEFRRVACVPESTISVIVKLSASNACQQYVMLVHHFMKGNVMVHMQLQPSLLEVEGQLWCCALRATRK